MVSGVTLTGSPPIESNSRRQDLKSKCSNNSASLFLSIARGARSLKDSCMPTSQRIVISSRAVGIQGKALRKFSPTTPVISSACATILSKVPYWLSHLTAVFGPTFSTPGTLSEVSPIKVR